MPKNVNQVIYAYYWLRDYGFLTEYLDTLSDSELVEKFNQEEWD